MKIAKRKRIELEKQAALYKAIAHPVRLAILISFNTCGCMKLTVKSIYETLGLEQPIVSHHLGILKRSGVVRREQKGGNTFYSICKEDLLVDSILQTLND